MKETDIASITHRYPPRPLIGLDTSLDAVDKWVNYYKIAHNVDDPSGKAAKMAAMYRTIMASRTIASTLSFRFVFLLHSLFNCGMRS